MKAALTAILSTTLLATFAFAQNRPQTFSNAVKYRDAGGKAASGRSGVAAIEARALLGRDGMTDLEITTGTFDGGAARGNIDKVQLKRVVDNRTITTNDTNLSNGGAYADRLASIRRGDVLSVQANVSGIEPNRTDVVAASESVKLRPDLAVSELLIPPVVRVNVPAVFTATVREVNGDVGARANCVLLVNGAEVDRAPGIWVDARGAVSCTFSATFTGGGVQQIAVAAVDVNPGDYDPANNSVSGQVYVLASAPFTRYRFEAVEGTRESRTLSSGPWGESNEVWTNPYQRTIFFGYVNQPMNLDTATARVQTWSNGVQLDDSVDIPLQRGGFSSDDGTWAYACFTGWDAATQRGITGCGSWYRYNGTVEGSLDLTTSREWNSVTYHSYGWDDRYYDIGGSYWRWNNTSHSETGAPLQWGSDVTLRVVLTDGDKTFEASPTAAFTPFHDEWGFGSCYTDSYTGDTYCNTFRRTNTGRQGVVSDGWW